ncbi:unnamed protein product [Peniophora sp. CBMAI 1063]|nr:unnamed protein product [Peniophora sp. CBMAI 1063]
MTESDSGRLCLTAVGEELAGSRAIATNLESSEEHTKTDPSLNYSLPILRLPPDILYRVIGTVAILCPASRFDLGWIKTTHVCSIWRHEIPSFATLWARAVSAFSSHGSVQTIRRRAQAAPLTVRYLTDPAHFGASWNISSTPLFDYYLALLPQVRSLDLCTPHPKDYERLVQALSAQTFPMLERVALADNCAPFDQDRRPVDPLTIFDRPLCPNLRALSLHRLFIAFPGRQLTDLRIFGESFSDNPITSARFLDFLSEAGETLQMLLMVQWMPTVWDTEERTGRKVRLRSLKSMSLLRPPFWTDYLALCRHIETPSLCSVSITNSCGPQSLSDALQVIDWILINGPSCPCIQNSGNLAAHYLTRDDPEENLILVMSPRELHCSDAGDLVSYQRRDADQPGPEGPGEWDPSQSKGVELQFSNVVYDIDVVDIQLVEVDVLFRSVVALYARWRVHCGLSPVVTASFKYSALFSLDLRSMLPDLCAVETLHVILPPYVEPATAANAEVGLLRSLAVLQPNGTFHLPHLKRLIYKQERYPLFIGPQYQKEVREILAKLQEQVDYLVAARARLPDTAISAACPWPPG